MCGREKHLPGALLAHLAGQVGRTEAAVETGHVGVCLAEAGVLGAGQREVADDVEAVAASGRPPGDDGDHHLRHKPDETLHLEYVEPADPARSPPAGLAALSGGSPRRSARAYGLSRSLHLVASPSSSYS